MARFLILEEDETEKKKDKKGDKDNEDDYTSGADDDILGSLNDDSNEKKKDSDEEESSKDISDLVNDIDSSSDDSHETSGLYESLAQISYICTVASNNMYHIMLNLTGKQFDNLRHITKNYVDELMYISRRYMDLAIQGDIIIDNLCNAKEHVDSLDIETAERYNYEDACRSMDKMIKAVLETLKTAREAAIDRTDISNILDREIEWANRESYYMSRRLNDPIAESTNLFNFEVR